MDSSTKIATTNLKRNFQDGLNMCIGSRPSNNSYRQPIDDAHVYIVDGFWRDLHRSPVGRKVREGTTKTLVLVPEFLHLFMCFRLRRRHSESPVYLIVTNIRAPKCPDNFDIIAYYSTLHSNVTTRWGQESRQRTRLLAMAITGTCTWLVKCIRQN